MNNIRKITTVKRKSNAKGGSIRDSLLKEGLSRIPGARMLLTPWKEENGQYRTGLDEDALYLRRLTQEQKESELSVIKMLKEKANDLFPGIDLSPRAPFYTDIFKHYEKENVGKTVKMKDGDNLFNLDKAYDLIAYAWLRVHPFVAPSGLLVNTGEYSRCDYYVNDIDVEIETKFKIQTRIATAIASLSAMNPSRLRKIARQCGFAVTEVDKQEPIFVKMYEFINESMGANKSNNLRLFESVDGLTQEALDIRDIVKRGFVYGVFKNFKQAVFQGDTRVAANEDELLEKLTDTNNQDMLLNVQQELKIKQSQVHA